MSDVRPMPQKRRSGKGLRKRGYHHGDLRTAMVAAALKLIAKHGPRGFSLSQAAKMAGVTAGAPYRHFADKEALFSTVAAEGFVELCERIEAANDANCQDPRRRLLAIAMAYVRFAMDRPSHFQVMFDSRIHRRQDPSLNVPADRAYQKLAEAVHEVSADKSASGQETLTAAIWALMHGLAIFGIDGTFTSMSFQTPLETLVENSIKLLLGH